MVVILPPSEGESVFVMIGLLHSLITGEVQNWTKSKSSWRCADDSQMVKGTQKAELPVLVSSLQRAVLCYFSPFVRIRAGEQTIAGVVLNEFLPSTPVFALCLRAS